MQGDWKKLSEGQVAPNSRWIAFFLGALSAFGYPTALILIGALAEFLFVPAFLPDGTRVPPDHLALSKWVHIPTSFIPHEGSLLRAAIGLIVLLGVLFSIDRLANHLCRKAALQAALDWSSDLLKQVFAHARLLSFDQGLAGQRQSLRDFVLISIPKIRECLVDWYRVFPRSVLQLLVVIVLAALIQPWVTLLAMLILLVVWALWNGIEVSQRKQRPVLLEQHRQAQDQLLYLCESSPVLESVDTRFDAGEAFERQLETFNLTQYKIAADGSWRSPVLLVVSVFFLAVTLFVISVRVLDPSSMLGVGGSIVLVGCIGIAINAIIKIRRCLRRKKNSKRSVQTLAEYLAIPSVRAKAAGSSKQADLSQGIHLEHVSFRDSAHARILEDVTLTLEPGKFSALVSLDAHTAPVLGEMVLGFGTPASGRILLNQTNLIDIDPKSIRKQTLLVNGKGPLLDGSLEENIWSGTPQDATIDVLELARKAQVSEAILNLPDGLGTVLANNDERLQSDHLFRIGILRALVKRPALVVVQEPNSRVSPQDEQDSLMAIEQLKELNAVVVVLPNRLSSLRRADVIHVFHEGRLVASGTHSQLLEKSESYRHYNYIRFASGNHHLG